MVGLVENYYWNSLGLQTNTSDHLASLGYYLFIFCFEVSLRLVFHQFNFVIHFICDILQYQEHRMILISREIFLDFVQ